MNVRLLAVVIAAALPALAQSESGVAFRVKVVNSLSGLPIPGASVKLDRQHTSRVWGRTDLTGEFRGRVSSSGSYLVLAARTGYRMMETEPIGRFVEIDSGQTEILVEMLPMGLLAGRVVDQYGDPVRGALVRVESRTDQVGREEYYESSRPAVTNDLGEYRIANVPPGKHFVAVEYSANHNLQFAGQAPGYPWPEMGGLVLYPNVLAIKQAEQLDVTDGQTTQVKEIRLNIGPAVTIAGKIKPPPGPAGSTLRLRHAFPIGLATRASSQRATPEKDGTFRLEVLPGEYVLTASDAQTGKVSRPLTLHVGQDPGIKEITGLELELSLLYEIRGKCLVDGPERPDYSQIVLDLNGRRANIDSSGNFEAKLSDGQVSYHLQGLPAGWYVKDIQLAGRHTRMRQLELEPGTSDLTFTLSSRAALLDIGLESRDRGFTPLLVALVSDTDDVPDAKTPLTAGRNPSGRFIVQSVPPGSYRVFSFDATNWFLAMRPDVLMAKYRNAAPLIQVSEGEHKTLVVPVSKTPAR